MKTIDKLLERIKKEGRSIGNSIGKNVGKKFIVPLTLTTLLTASAQDARADLKKVWQEIKNRTSIEASYSYGWPKLNKEFIDKLNDDIKTGKITTYPMIHNQLIEPAKSLSTYGGKINFRVWERKDKGVSAYVNAGYEQGKTNTNYSATEYSEWDPSKTKPVNINRNEETKIKDTSLGVKLTKELSDKFNISVSGGINLYNINGNANLTWRYPYTNYTQWRTSESEGKATGFSAGVDLEYKLGKNVSVSGGVGYKNAKVSTSGIEYIKSTSNPTWSPWSLCDQEVDVTGLTINGKLNVKF